MEWYKPGTVGIKYRHGKEYMMYVWDAEAALFKKSIVQLFLLTLSGSPHELHGSADSKVSAPNIGKDGIMLLCGGGDRKQSMKL